MFEELIGKNVKIVFQDGSNIIVFFGEVDSTGEGFICLKPNNNSSLKYLSWRSIIKVEEVGE